MRVNALNEYVRKLVHFIGLQVDFVSGLLPMCGLFILQLFFEVEDLVIAALRESIIVRLKVCDEFSLALASGHQVFHVLLNHSGFLCLVHIAKGLLRRLVQALQTVAGLTSILLHANLGVARMQVGFRDLLGDGLHSVLAHLTHSHLSRLVEGACLCDSQSFLLLVGNSGLSLDRGESLATRLHVFSGVGGDDVCLLEKADAILRVEGHLRQVLIQPLETVVGAHQVRDRHIHVRVHHLQLLLLLLDLLR